MTVDRLLSALLRSGFAGELEDDLGSRAVYSTDNSIYQVLPAAIIYPKSVSDVVMAVRHAAEHKIALSPRGGGTGTNGQSLTKGVIVDISRHMNGIDELDLEAGTVRVQPGVVLNQLNDFLKPHGYFFPPTVSTASRATLGGMVATDASGKGSRIYGKTSDYIEEMDIVLADATIATIKTVDVEEARHIAGLDHALGRAYREVLRVVIENAQEIEATFPKMNRGLTGYNLQSVIGSDGRVRLSYLLAGSEGTLAFTTGLKLRIVRRPAYRALVPIRYEHFQTALEDVQRLIAANPSAVEIIDDKVLFLAQQDSVWTAIESVLGRGSQSTVGGLSFVEFLASSKVDLDAQLASFAERLRSGPQVFIDWAIVTDANIISELWSLREKSVGLLGRISATKQGTAFVEDTAVPPEMLPAFVKEFRAILDAHGVSYGMYGHADVGCLHVRPALNMRDESDAALIRPISDQVAQLSKKYGGLLWGEHGRGYRGEYSPFFFGPTLYRELCAIKSAFDPLNLFNPGKLAAPIGENIDRIDAVMLRGEADRQIDQSLAKIYDRAIACNGNGACFNWDTSDPMCPSYKATRDRKQSPKGRAALFREWSRLASQRQQGKANKDLQVIEESLRTSLSTCLSCKACSSQCPVKVDIPSMKAQFLQSYYSKRRRPLRDHVVMRSEGMFRFARWFPRLANFGQSVMSASGLLKAIGLADLPAFDPPRRGKTLRKRDYDKLATLSESDKARTIILLEDTFTSTFDGRVVEAARHLFVRLGYDVWSASPIDNGKAAHVVGMLKSFEAAARTNMTHQSKLLSAGIPVIGIEAIPLLMPDHEYKHLKDMIPTGRSVQAIEDFLAAEIDAGRTKVCKTSRSARTLSLFLHCTEKTAKPNTANTWTKVLNAFGFDVNVVSTGCCGMAGMYGHEIEHVDMSRDLFNMSWADKLSECGSDQALMTGFSCRCQTKRFTGRRAEHPVEALSRALSDCSDTTR